MSEARVGQLELENALLRLSQLRVVGYAVRAECVEVIDQLRVAGEFDERDLERVRARVSRFRDGHLANNVVRPGHQLGGEVFGALPRGVDVLPNAPRGVEQQHQIQVLALAVRLDVDRRDVLPRW